MNMRLGRIGPMEGTAAAATAMTVGGIFSFETDRLYKGGNSSYLTLPLAALFSLCVFLVVSGLMEKSGEKNLGDLMRSGAGKLISAIFAAILALFLIFSAFEPLSQFTRAMHGLFFDGVSYSRIVVFTLPAVIVCALLGLETIGRTAKLISPILFFVLLLSTAASISEFEVYRLYPFPGKPVSKTALQTLEQTVKFLPALLCLLINADGLNGIKTAKRAGVAAALISAFVCFFAHFALALCYTYRQLGELFMPMFRINYLNKFEAHFMRMDKLAHMIWLGGGMISSAFYIHAGARLFSESFEMRDIRPAIGGGIALTALLIMLEVESELGEALHGAKAVLNDYGFIALGVIPLVIGLIAIDRGKKKKNAQSFA